jgi:hypothetical protein
MIECAAQIKKVSTKDLSEQEIKSALGVVKKITENLTEFLGEDSSMTDLKKTKN